MYRYKPEKQTKAHIVLPVFLILLCAASLVCAKIGRYVPPAIMQFIAVLCAAFAIQIISRYSLTVFTYEADEEKRTFSVYKAVGKKSQLVAAVEYDDIITIDKKEKDYSPKKKYNKTYKMHNFCANIYPTEAYCVVCNVEENDIAIIIEADETLLKLLERR